MSLDRLDAATRRLIMEIQQQDLQDLVEQVNRKGKGREGEMTDIEAALDAYKAELAETEQVLHDREVCVSINRAVSLDADMIGTVLIEEQQAHRDRNMARELDRPGRESETDEHHPGCAPNLSTSGLDNESIERLRVMYACPPEEPENLPESSAWAATRLSEHPLTQSITDQKRECVACAGAFRFFDLASCTGCTHEYCRDCLTSVFETSLVDERYFPPRCCREPIQVESCRLFLSPELVERFSAKKLEFDTPNRTYCSQPACSAWVPPEFIENGTATCQRCESKTCVVCKASSHGGATECPQDPAFQALLGLAADEGWQMCYSCKRVVELTMGCNHMSKCIYFFPLAIIS